MNSTLADTSISPAQQHVPLRPLIPPIAELPPRGLALSCTRGCPPAEAKQPEDWDEEEDGEWEPPRIPNPLCVDAPGCGEWKPPMKRNPEYKGKWSAPLVDNPEYKVCPPPGKKTRWGRGCAEGALPSDASATGRLYFTTAGARLDALLTACFTGCRPRQDHRSSGLLTLRDGGTASNRRRSFLPPFTHLRAASGACSE